MGAHHIEAAVPLAEAVGAALAGVAHHALAGVHRALAVDAGLAFDAVGRSAGVRDAIAVAAALTEGTAHCGAASDAATLATELPGVAEEPRAGIGLADEADATLTRRAASLEAVVGDTLTGGADLAGRTRNALAGIHTRAVAADGLVGALDKIAGIGAEAVDADLDIGALIIGARIDAVIPAADLAWGADGLVVDRAIAVVVFAVAGLDGDLGAEAADVALGLVDGAVAVVVEEVAALGLAGLIGRADEAAAGTDAEAASADARITGGAGLILALGGVVDDAIAVVVEAVADLGRRRDVRHTLERHVA